MMTPNAGGRRDGGTRGAHFRQRWPWLRSGEDIMRLSAELPRVLNKATLSVGPSRYTLAEWLEHAEPNTLLYRYVVQQSISLLLWEVLQCTDREFSQKLPLLISMVVPRRLEPVMALRQRLIEPADGRPADLPLNVDVPTLVLHILGELGLGDVEPFMVRKLVTELSQLAQLPADRVMDALLASCEPIDQAFLQGVPQIAR